MEVKQIFTLMNTVTGEVLGKSDLVALEKLTVSKLPEAEENESWELTNGKSYDPNIFYKPEFSPKFFNKRVTFDIPMSFTKDQVKESFSNAEQLNSFITMTQQMLYADSAYWNKVTSLFYHQVINDIVSEITYNKFS